ncbi:hypothetical protein PR202_gb07359 [Eleusine coracana subsp. coracana]|uniref:Expansin-like EG45 domain-containing protein n=1 Tax=Eleusine coracana subsp. coracana TaxID=191504 RepID=A0AAV5EBY6_ELECO|nr:hypothetical protein PR202_gb07359 [Eleusine coracana subsp. coracana]
MASSSFHNTIAMAAVLMALLFGSSCAHHPQVPPGPNITTDYDGRWLAARATWYGKPTGAGPDDNGGACGLKNVNLPPYNGMTTCGNLPLFKDGKGCGSCYEIKCTKPECSNSSVVVFITDMNYDLLSPYHFDLSGKAFGAMSKPGMEDKLRHRGIIDLQFRRVRCTYPRGQKIAFHVQEGSNPFYLALLVKFVADDGDIFQMDIMEKETQRVDADAEAFLGRHLASRGRSRAPSPPVRQAARRHRFRRTGSCDRLQVQHPVLARFAHTIFGRHILTALVSGGSCARPNVPPGPTITTDYDGTWLTAKATCAGGAYGVKDVNLPPYIGMTSCGNLPLFKDRKGCGSCYEIKCTNPEECSNSSVVEFITDMNYDLLSPYHLDLSGKAFGAMSKPGTWRTSSATAASSTELNLILGRIKSSPCLNVRYYCRVRCIYQPGQNIAFHVEKGSNPFFRVE